MKSSIVKSTALVLMLLLAVSCGMTKAQKTESADIHYKLGVLHLGEREYPDAMKELTAAIELNPEEATYYNALGFAYFARGIFDKAIANYNKAVELKPDYSEAYLNLSAVYIEQKDWDGAIRSSESVLRNVFYKTPEVAHNNIGWAHLNKDNLDEALAAFNRALTVQPRYPMALNNMGLVYERLGETAQAIESYKKAISIDPKLVNAYFNLGFVLMREDDKPGAREVFEKIVEISPDTPAAETANVYIERLK